MSHVLCARRRALGWSQADLARRAGISRPEVSAVETARHAPSVTVALRLAAALDTTVEALFGPRTTDGPASLAPVWPARDPQDSRVWLARLGSRTRTYPVEATSAGAIPHDGTWRGRLRGRGGDDLSARTVVIAGCDPFAGVLARELAARHGIRLLPLLRSGADALALLRQGLVHAAGLHASDPDGRSRNRDVAAAALGDRARLVRQLHWDSGVALPASRRERTPGAVVRGRLRWVNREPGSGARRLFDALFASRRAPAGHDRIVGDHRAVAATVASGWAEAGICVRPVAREAGLGFVPICREAYDLCTTADVADDPRVRALVEVLRSAAYREAIDAVPGCSARGSGEWRR